MSWTLHDKDRYNRILKVIFIGKGKTDKVKTDKEIDDNPSLLTVACSYRSREGEFHSRLRKSLDH